MLILLAFCLLCQQAPPQSAPHASEPRQIQSRRLDVAAELLRNGVEVEFVGNEVFSSRELLEMLSQDGRAAEWFVEGIASEKFAEGDSLTQTFEASLQWFSNLLRSRGYLQAKVHGPRIAPSSATRKVILTVDEGTLYRLGEVKFEQAKLFSPEQLREMLPLRRGDVANGELLGNFLFGRLKELYADRGHIQHSADAEPTFHEPPPGGRAGVVDFLITIDEGKRFTLHSIELSGNAMTPDDILRPAIVLRDGEPFRQTLLDESLKNLEGLGLFEKIDRGKDVDYAVGEEPSQVKIKIKLKEKPGL
jgi:outer membrane protein insertion porin family